MLVLALAVSLAAAAQAPEVMTRSVLTDVCLPFVAGEDPQGPLDFLGFVGPGQGETRQLQTEDSAYIVRLSASDGEASGDTRRTCVIVPRRGGIDAALSAVRRPLLDAGFVAETGLPADRPIWTRGGVTVSLRQNEGRSVVIRVSYSGLDAEAG